MIALAFFVAWSGYTVGLYGYCVVKRYNLCFADMLRQPANGWQWPPPQDMSPGTVLPQCTDSGTWIPGKSTAPNSGSATGSPPPRFTT